MDISKACLLVLTALVTVGCAASQPTVARAPGSEPLMVASADGRAVKLDELWSNRKATVLVFY